MAKFRFYIWNEFDGKFEGTDSEESAQMHSETLELPAVNTETGEWRSEGGDWIPVERCHNE